MKLHRARLAIPAVLATATRSCWRIRSDTLWLRQQDSKPAL